MNINRRRFLQGTAALFCAPAIVKAENIMRVVAPKVILPVSVNISVTGLIPDDRILLIDPVTGEVLDSEVADSATYKSKIIYEADKEVQLVVRNTTKPYMPFSAYTAQQQAHVQRELDSLRL